MFVRSFAVALLIAAVAGPAFAQAPSEVSAEEATLYATFTIANDAKDATKAFEVAREYLKQYPQGAYAQYLSQYVVAARAAAFNQAIQAGDLDGMIKIGRERLAEDPQDLDYLMGMLTTLRRKELGGPPPDKHPSEILMLAQQAIQALEAGRKPSGDASKFDKNVATALLLQTAALTEQRQGRDQEALDGYAKSSALDPTSMQIAAFNALQSATVRQKRYNEAVARFLAVPEAQRQPPTPEAKAILDQANAEADGTIGFWARFIAISEARNAMADRRERVRKDLAELWAYRNPTDAQGFQKAIDTQKAALPPVS